jgi:DNA-binding Lrp family transcriptional regulator
VLVSRSAPPTRSQAESAASSDGADSAPGNARILRADLAAPNLNEPEMWLVTLLQADGRISYADIARRTGMTEKTARRKVSMLLEEAFIQVTAVTDPALLGYTTMGLACITVDGTVSTSELADSLSAISEVDYVTCTTGRFALQAELMCADPGELQRVVDQRIRALPGVARVEVLAYLRLHYQQARFEGVLPDEGADPEGVRPRALDEVDRRIVSLLAVDGRAPFSELATALEVSETMVRQRYQQLVASGAMKVMCIANPLRLGFRSTGWIAVKASASARSADIAEALTRLSAVTYVAITAGRYDVLAEVVCVHHEDLLSLVDEKVRAVTGVASVELWLYLDLRYKPLQPQAVQKG